MQITEKSVLVSVLAAIVLLPGCGVRFKVPAYRKSQHSGHYWFNRNKTLSEAAQDCRECLLTTQFDMYTGSFGTVYTSSFGPDQTLGRVGDQWNRQSSEVFNDKDRTRLSFHASMRSKGYQRIRKHSLGSNIVTRSVSVSGTRAYVAAKRQ
jgi:hypothetical protein